uniref:Uncharacterized protein n=1 Tax=Anopheles atroparvus TaxID=41427 RepID=A0A182JH56_ANOAO
MNLPSHLDGPCVDVGPHSHIIIIVIIIIISGSSRDSAGRIMIKFNQSPAAPGVFRGVVGVYAELQRSQGLPGSPEGVHKRTTRGERSYVIQHRSSEKRAPMDR